MFSLAELDNLSCFFFSSRRRHTRCYRDWSSDVCSSDLAVARGLALGGSQLACHLAFLAHQAWLMSDAIVRTLVRLGVTRRTMLEWVTAARTKAGLRREIGGAYRRMHGAIALAVAAGMLVALVA